MADMHFLRLSPFGENGPLMQDSCLVQPGFRKGGKEPPLDHEGNAFIEISVVSVRDFSRFLFNKTPFEHCKYHFVKITCPCFDCSAIFKTSFSICQDNVY